MNELPQLVIVGRDGVINERPVDAVDSPEAWRPIPGSLESIARLNHAGIRVAVATNQPAVGNGLISLDQLNRVHERLASTLARFGGHIDGIFFCPHTPGTGCECHKPQAGLLRSISLRFGVALQGVPVIGDDPDDVRAARAARARPMLVRTGRGEQTISADPGFAELPCFDDLAHAVGSLLTRTY